MKLHRDGTIEGTPQELAEYSRLIAEKKEPFKVVLPQKLAITDYPSVETYVNALLGATKKDYH